MTTSSRNTRGGVGDNKEFFFKGNEEKEEGEKGEKKNSNNPDNLIFYYI